jgi:hypothetical protein
MPVFRWDRDEIEARVRMRADMVGSTFVSDAEVTTIVDVAFQEFYLKFVSQFEELCVVMAPATIALTAIATLFEVPLDFLKMKGVKIANEYFLTPVSNVMETERFRRNAIRGKPTHYWLAGVGDLTLAGTWRPALLMPLPLPDAAYSLECYYVPNLTLDSVQSDSSTVATLALGYGGDEYVVLTAAMKLKDKEESDCSVIMAERKMYWESMEKFLTPMDESMPKGVVPLKQHRYDPFDAEDDFG